jgi:hypothetical protein
MASCEKVRRSRGPKWLIVVGIRWNAFLLSKGGI